MVGPPSFGQNGYFCLFTVISPDYPQTDITPRRQDAKTPRLIMRSTVQITVLLYILRPSLEASALLWYAKTVTRRVTNNSQSHLTPSLQTSHNTVLNLPALLPPRLAIKLRGCININNHLRRSQWWGPRLLVKTAIFACLHKCFPQ